MSLAAILAAIPAWLWIGAAGTFGVAFVGGALAQLSGHPCACQPPAGSAWLFVVDPDLGAVLVALVLVGVLWLTWHAGRWVARRATLHGP